MITCPNCEHQNPEEALQCENCYSSLPGSNHCPNCGASVQVDATFCGQCGFNLQAVNLVPETEVGETVQASELNLDLEPEPMVTASSSPIASPWDEEDSTMARESDVANDVAKSINRTELGEAPADLSASLETDSEPGSTTFMPSNLDDSTEVWDTETGEPFNSATNVETGPWDFIEAPIERFEPEAERRSPVEIEPEVNASSPESLTPTEEPRAAQQTTESVETAETANKLTSLEPLSSTEEPRASEQPASEIVAEERTSNSTSSPTDTRFDSATQLQTFNISLLHVQTNTVLKIPQDLDVIHIGKPNSKIPPDIDVSGFANSEIVSRIHADLRVEGDLYFLEDAGSSNGTYINHLPLIPGNRHRLRAGDRIALGKGDLVSFIFQME
ncbi:FHA domain-containing protein [Myxosarcina sp. GI1(2024)]